MLFEPHWTIPDHINQAAIKCVVPFSGGKDSTACFKLAVGYFGLEHVIGLFCDTKWEHSETYQFVRDMNAKFDNRIITLHTPEEATVPNLVRRYGYFPSGKARFCTQLLKIAPSKFFYYSFAESRGEGFQVWYGMRKEESNDRKIRYSGKIGSELYDPYDVNENYGKKLVDLGVYFVLPVVDWSLDLVYQYCDEDINPLYAKGADRVGCAPCLAAGDATKNRYFRMDSEGWDKYLIVRGLEQETGESAWRSKKLSGLSSIKVVADAPKEETAECSFCNY